MAQCRVCQRPAAEGDIYCYPCRDEVSEMCAEYDGYEKRIDADNAEDAPYWAQED